MIQLPEDMIRIQEVIYRLKPDVIIETGVAHGGSLIFYSSICKAMEKGRVIGVDIEIRSHNRAAIKAHELFDRTTLIEGSSIAPEIVAQVKSQVKPGELVLVILDSNRTYAHVYDELEAYAGLVTLGSYIVATDGIIFDLVDLPWGTAEWLTDNPTNAVLDSHPQKNGFVVTSPIVFRRRDLKTRYSSAHLPSHQNGGKSTHKFNP